MQFEYIEITDRMRKRAWSKMKQANRRSGHNFVHKEHQTAKSFTGFLCEEGPLSWEGARASSGDDVYDYDLEINGYKIEVKGTQTKYHPKPNFDCKLWGYHDQQFDFVVFCRAVTRDYPVTKDSYDEIIVVGWISKEDFSRKSKKWKKGDYDPSNGQTMKGDSENVLISDLRPISELKDILYG